MENQFVDPKTTLDRPPMNRSDGAARMIRFGLSPRIARLTRREAQEYWAGQHARLFSRVPGLVSYVQNHAVLQPDGKPLSEDFGFDIFSEVEFASPEAMSIAVSSPYYRDVILPDEHFLLDASKRAFLVMVRAGKGSTGLPNGAIKLVQFRTRAESKLSPGRGSDINSSAGWNDSVTNIAGWPGVPPAIVRQIPCASVEAAAAACRQTLDGTVLLSVIVKQKVVVSPRANDAP
ncbi:EthD domain-containing protein [Nitrobacteraceae bacterium UC4446_H13]